MAAKPKHSYVVVLDADGTPKVFPTGMPFFVLLGRDPHAPAAIEAYAQELDAVASDVADENPATAGRLRDIADDARACAMGFRAWQIEHPEDVKDPD